jgi:hypothetical protein
MHALLNSPLRSEKTYVPNGWLLIYKLISRNPIKIDSRCRVFSLKWIYLKVPAISVVYRVIEKVT